MKINLPNSYTLENTSFYISKNPRRDLLAGAGFFASDNWTYDATNWTYNAGVMEKDADGTGVLEKAIGAIDNGIYEIVYTISLQGANIDWNKGDFVVECGGGRGTRHQFQSFFLDDISEQYGNGTYRDIIEATGTGNLKFIPSKSARFTIDNITATLVGHNHADSVNTWISDFDSTDSRLNIYTEKGQGVINIGEGRITINRTMGGYFDRPLHIETRGECVFDGSSNCGSDNQLTHRWEAIKVTATGLTNTNAGIVTIRLKVSGTITNVTDSISFWLYTDNGGKPGVVISDENNEIRYGFLQGDNGSTARWGWDIGNYVEVSASITNTYDLAEGISYWIVIKRITAPTGGNIYHEMINTGVSTHAYATVTTPVSGSADWTLENNKQGWYRFYSPYGANIQSISQYSTSVTGYGFHHPGGYFCSILSDALQGETLSTIAVHGITTHGIAAVQGDNVNGVGVWGYSESEVGGKFRRHVDTASLASIMTVLRTGGGSTTPLYGGGIRFDAYNANSDTTLMGRIGFIMPDRTASAESVACVIYANENAVENEVARIDGDSSQILGIRVAAYSSVSVADANKNILNKASIETGVAVGDLALVNMGSEMITDPFPFYRITTVAANNLTLDRNCKSAGSDQTNFKVTIFKNAMLMLADITNDKRAILNYSDSNLPLQIGGNANLASTGHSLVSTDILVAGKTEFDDTCYFDGNVIFSGTSNNLINDSKGKIINGIYSAASSSSDIKGFWIFDQTGATTTINDRSTVNHSVTLSANASTLTPGIIGLAPFITFNGVNYWSTADHVDFTQAAFSIIAIINPTDVTGMTLLAKWDETTGAELREFRFGIGSDDKLFGHVYDETNNAQVGRKYNTAITSDEGSWNVYIMTYSAASGVRLWRNGVQVDDTADNAGAGFASIVNTTSVVGNFIISTAGTRTNISNAEEALKLYTSEEFSSSIRLRLHWLLRSWTGNNLN